MLSNNNSYNHVLSKLQDYMFTEEKLNNSIQYNIISNLNKKNTDKNMDKKQDNNIIKNKINNKYFIPKENDTLFWCFYIIKFGEIKYETENKNLLNEKKIKIDYVSKIRNNKAILKKYKFDTLTNIENNLVNDKCINLSTFFSLCCIENINVVLINEKKKFYYELKIYDDEIVYEIYDLFDIKKYGLHTNQLNKSEYNIEYRENYYKVENLDKPIKSLSFYKVEDLISICNKLKINTIDDNTNKLKNKKQLYESIIQYF